MTRRDHLRFGFAIAVLGCTLAVGYQVGRARAAGIPAANTLVFNGTLNTFGAPDNGTHNMLIALYIQGSTSSPACSSSTMSVTCVNGQFSIPLPANCVPIIHANPSTLAQITVDGTALGMTPISAVPYAVEADTASNPAPGSALATLQSQVQNQIGILGVWFAQGSGITVNGTTWTAIPGATVSLSVPSSATLEMSADGSVSGTSSSANHCGFRFVVDGTARGDPTWGNRIIGCNSSAGADSASDGWWCNWSMKDSVPVAAGAHTVLLQQIGWSPTQGCVSDGGAYSDSKLFIIAH